MALACCCAAVSLLKIAHAMFVLMLPPQEEELGDVELWPSLAVAGQPQTPPPTAKTGAAAGSSTGGSTSGGASGGGGGDGRVSHNRLLPKAAAWAPSALAGQQQQVQQPEAQQQAAPVGPPTGSTDITGSAAGRGGSTAGAGLSYGGVLQSLKAASCAEQLRGFGFTAAEARAAADASGGDVEAATELLVEGLLAAEVAAAQ